MKTQIEQIVEAISEAISPRKIFLFGSRAHGDHDMDSDIDLLIVHDGPETKLEIKRKIHRLFSAHDFSLDVFVLTSNEVESTKRVANTLARTVSETGIVCYG